MLVAARGPADAEIDAPGIKRLEHAEGLGDLVGAVMRQHDPARADADRLRLGRHPRDQNLRRRARQTRRVVMLSQPIAVKAQRIRPPRQLQRLVERLCHGPARAHGRLVEDGELERRGHAAGSEAEGAKDLVMWRTR